ncbi:MAG: glycine--tRNA ligase subunit beta, partial [Thermoanaerobaculia bacterium]
MAEYFFELLTEEIPAWMHETAAATLRERLTQLATQLGVEDAAQALTLTTTPRRIIFVLRGLPVREADREQEVKGPPKKSAYDAEGNPTQALHGFLKKQNASLDDVLNTDDAYIVIRRKITGRETGALLQE